MYVWGVSFYIYCIRMYKYRVYVYIYEWLDNHATLTHTGWIRFTRSESHVTLALQASQYSLVHIIYVCMYRCMCRHSSFTWVCLTVHKDRLHSHTHTCIPASTGLWFCTCIFTICSRTRSLVRSLANLPKSGGQFIFSFEVQLFDPVTSTIAARQNSKPDDAEDNIFPEINPLLNSPHAATALLLIA